MPDANLITSDLKLAGSAWMKMRFVACHIDAHNLASRSVAERAGFVLEHTQCVPGAAPNGSSVSTCFYTWSV
jgi:RimJ/RimL family protein N-acetyltransferase